MNYEQLNNQESNDEIVDMDAFERDAYHSYMDQVRKVEEERIKRKNEIFEEGYQRLLKKIIYKIKNREFDCYGTIKIYYSEMDNVEFGFKNYVITRNGKFKIYESNSGANSISLTYLMTRM